MSSGSVKIDSKELSCMKEEELAKLRLTEIGFIFQQSNLLRNLNLFDNIILSAYLAKCESKKIVNKRALGLMENMGISDIASHYITEASGGNYKESLFVERLLIIQILFLQMSRRVL